MTNNNQPAFPSSYEFYKEGQHNVQHYAGMDKRFYAACIAMQGLIAGGYVSLTNGMVAPSLLVKKAYEISDELLKQEIQ